MGGLRFEERRIGVQTGGHRSGYVANRLSPVPIVAVEAVMARWRETVAREGKGLEPEVWSFQCLVNEMALTHRDESEPS